MGTRLWACVQMTAWNRRTRRPMSCGSSVSSNYLSSCCFGGLLSIPWCIAATRCSAPKSEQALTKFSVDVLHIHHLGIFQDWILRALWLFVDFDILGARRKAKAQILTETLSRIRRMLSAWYPIYEKKLADNKVTRVGSVFNNLTGTDDAKGTAAKGS